MEFSEVVSLPFRLTSAATRTTLALGHLVAPDGPILRPGGYGSRIAQIVGEGGLIEQVTRMLQEERGVVQLANTISELIAPERPLGKALEPGGIVDRFADEDGPFIRLIGEDGPLFRLLAPGGPAERLLGEDGPVFRMLAPGGPADRLLAKDGPLHRFLEPGGPLDRMLAEDGDLERLLAPGGVVEQLLEDDGVLERLVRPGGTLDQLASLGDAIPNLHAAVEILSSTVEPLSTIAGRIPMGRRRGLVASRGQGAGEPPANGQIR